MAKVTPVDDLELKIQTTKDSIYLLATNAPQRDEWLNNVQSCIHYISRGGCEPPCFTPSSSVLYSNEQQMRSATSPMRQFFSKDALRRKATGIKRAPLLRSLSGSVSMTRKSKGTGKQDAGYATTHETASTPSLLDFKRWSNVQGLEKYLNRVKTPYR